MASAALEKDPAATLTRDDRGGKYLVFELGREEFGIRVLQVGVQVSRRVGGGSGLAQRVGPASW